MEQLFNEFEVPRLRLEDRVGIALDGVGVVMRLGHVLVIMQKPIIMQRSTGDRDPDGKETWPSWYGEVFVLVPTLS